MTVMTTATMPAVLPTTAPVSKPSVDKKNCDGTLSQSLYLVKSCFHMKKKMCITNIFYHIDHVSLYSSLNIIDKNICFYYVWNPFVIYGLIHSTLLLWNCYHNITTCSIQLLALQPHNVSIMFSYTAISVTLPDFLEWVT